MALLQSRRDFATTLSLAGAAALIGAFPAAADEGPPETTTVRLWKWFPAGCEIPEYVADGLLRAEGFTDVRFVSDQSGDTSEWIARGEIDFDWNYAAIHVTSIQAGVPITVLAGMHAGCLELIGNDSVRSIADLKGKRVGVWDFGSGPHVLVTLMAAYIGLDPSRDINWVKNSDVTSLDLFTDGKVDAFLAAPPEPQILRARRIGHTILATAVDKPWSQYYCCMLAGRAEYVRKYPVATKRVLRALLKTVDHCAAQPQAVARQMVDGGFAESYDFTLQTLTEVRFDRWREYDPEDTMRFYALRLKEVGLIKSDPETLIAASTDWRFLNEIKRELKT